MALLVLNVHMTDKIGIGVLEHAESLKDKYNDSLSKSRQCTLMWLGKDHGELKG